MVSTVFRSACAAAVVPVVLAALAVSPWLRVRTVAWTGVPAFARADCPALEAAILGRPLFLLPEALLRDRLGLPDEDAKVRIHRHLPDIVEIEVEVVRGLARLDDGRVVAPTGRLLPRAAVAVATGLPVLRGLEPAGERLAPDTVAWLRALHEGLRAAGLHATQIQVQGADLEVALRAPESNLRLRRDGVLDQLRKLRIFEESLAGQPLPRAIDLRFRDQIVVPATGEG